MINAYPSINAVNRYQTHKDYFRVGAVTAVSGGKSNTIRRMLNLPFEELAYKQFAQSAAKDVASFVKSAQNVKQSAETLIEASVAASAKTLPTTVPTEEKQTNITKTIQDFIHTYNDLQDQLRDSPDYVSHPLLQGLEGAARPNTLQDLGITKQDDGKLVLQADVLQGQISKPNNVNPTSLSQLTRFASSLASTIDQLQELPSASLFKLSSSPLKPYGQYQSKLNAYLPVPMSGLLLDAKM